MSDLLTSPGGVVRVADRDVLLTPLSVAAEAALYDDLERLARRQLGPEGRFKLVAPAVEHYLAAGQVVLARMIVAEAAAAELADARLDFEAVAVRAARTAEGVALELFHRGRAAHPGRTLAEYEAVVTPANAAGVFQAIREALVGPGKVPAASPSPT